VERLKGLSLEFCSENAYEGQGQLLLKQRFRSTGLLHIDVYD